MSWYKESDGTIIVTGLDDLVHSNITFKMSTVRRDDGKLVLIDYQALYLCGKRVRRPSSRRPPRYKPAIQHVCEDIIDSFVTRDVVPDNCPMEKSKCVFWNDVFLVCSANECVKNKEKTDEVQEVPS